VPRASWVHALDARTKIASVALLAGAAVAGRTVGSQVLLLLVLATSFAVARIPVAVLGRGLRGALWLLGFVAVANVGWSFLAARAGWAPGEGAVGRPADLVLLLLRLFNLLTLAGLFTSTTVPVDAAEAFERLLLPLRRLRLPVHELGFLLVLALSFVPILGQEARRLADCHRVKVGRARWRLGDRARAAVPLLVPLFLAALRRADDLAVALEARCFVPGAPRTTLAPGRFRAADLAALGAATAALAACAGMGP